MSRLLVCRPCRKNVEVGPGVDKCPTCGLSASVWECTEVEEPTRKRDGGEDKTPPEEGKDGGVTEKRDALFICHACWHRKHWRTDGTDIPVACPACGSKDNKVFIVDDPPSAKGGVKRALDRWDARQPEGDEKRGKDD